MLDLLSNIAEYPLTKMGLGRRLLSSRVRVLQNIGIMLRVRKLKRSGVFDGPWYQQRYPDVAETGIDPARHFVMHGWYQGRRPGLDADLAQIEKLFDEKVPAPRRQELDALGAQHVAYYGETLHELIDFARARTSPTGDSADYDTIRDEFDFAFYLTRYRSLTFARKLDLVAHYMQAGVQERRDPCAYFSTKQYFERYPEVEDTKENPFLHWLAKGRSEGRVASPFVEFDEISALIGLPSSVAQDALIDKHKDIRARLEYGVLGEMIAKAAELDPLIAKSWPAAFQPKIPPFHSEQQVSRLAAIHRLQERAGLREARFVVIVNKPRWGGARRMEGYIAHALAELHGAENVILVASDAGGVMPPGKVPDGVRYVDFASDTHALKENDRQRVLVEFLRSLGPEVVFNVNSALLWRTLAPHGKALAASMRIYGCLFCNEQTALGFWTGYPIKNFYRYFDTLAGICTDSHALAEALIERHRVPPDRRKKLTVLSAPVDADLPVFPNAPVRADNRPRVYWSGRFDRQKRVDIVYKIAEQMPEIDVHMWGEHVLDKSSVGLKKPENVILEGVYEDFSDLPLSDADLWLYTSEWDGVPSILIELAMTGLPIVGSLAGGTGEVLRENFSWPVRDLENVEIYVASIKEILAEPAAARSKALGLRKAMLAERTKQSYSQTLAELTALEIGK